MTIARGSTGEPLRVRRRHSENLHADRGGEAERRWSQRLVLLRHKVLRCVVGEIRAAQHGQLAFRADRVERLQQ